MYSDKYNPHGHGGQHHNTHNNPHAAHPNATHLHGQGGGHYPHPNYGSPTGYDPRMNDPRMNDPRMNDPRNMHSPHHNPYMDPYGNPMGHGMHKPDTGNFGRPMGNDNNTHTPGMWGPMAKPSDNRTQSSNSSRSTRFKKRSRRNNSNPVEVEVTQTKPEFFNNTFTDFEVTELEDISADELKTRSIESLTNLAKFKTKDGIYSLSGFEERIIISPKNVDLKDMVLTSVMNDILVAQDKVYTIDSYKEDLAELKEITGHGVFTPIFVYVKSLEDKVCEIVEERDDEVLAKLCFPFHITIVKDKGVASALQEIQPGRIYSYDHKGMIGQLACRGKRTIIATPFNNYLVQAGKITVVENLKTV